MLLGWLIAAPCIDLFEFVMLQVCGAQFVHTLLIAVSDSLVAQKQWPPGQQSAAKKAIF